MRKRTWRAGFAAALLLALAFAASQTALGTRSDTSVSRGSLARKLTKVNRQIKHVESLTRRKKKERKYAKLDLEATQRRLEVVQGSVVRNKSGLARSQYQLKVIKARLDRNKRQLDRRVKLLSRRLVDIYQGEDIAYLDVMLGSRDMRTFVSRGYYVRQIVSSDVKLIKDIKKAREEIEADKKAQAAEVERIARLQAQLVDQRDEVADLEQQRSERLEEIEHDLALYERKLAELMAESERIGGEIRRLQSTPEGKARYARKFTGALGLPVPGRITSRFGYRVHPITRVHALHTGVDIACPTGTPVHAAADGEVILAGWMGAYGYAVVIDHGGGVSTLYGHNSKLVARVGQQVSRGEVIARSGSTGWSTGPHVHFERRKDGRPVNPL